MPRVAIAHIADTHFPQSQVACSIQLGGADGSNAFSVTCTLIHADDLKRQDCVLFPTELTRWYRV